VAGGSLIPLTKQQAVWWARLSGGAQDVPATGAGPTPGSVESTLINFMAVRAIVSSPNGPLHDGSWAEKSVRFRQVLTDGDARLVVNQDALPRAYCVSSWRVSQSIEDTLDILSNPYFDGVHGCVIAEGTPGLEALEGLVPETRHPTVAGIPNDDSVATCTMTEDSAERIVIHVEGSEPVVTVLADNFTPGWHATLDGIAWPILQTNGIFRGIATPAGAHDIVFTYRPVSFTVGLGATLGAVVMFVLLGLRSLVRKG